MPPIRDKKSVEIVFGKTPRSGQMDAFRLLDDYRRQLNVKLPTGYGKSFTLFGCFSLLKKRGRVSRLLIIVPTVAQLTQFCEDGYSDMEDARIDGSKEVCNLPTVKEEALAPSRSGCQVFVTTIQYLTYGGKRVVARLLDRGEWMIAVDEYHHYGQNCSWGKTLGELPHEFLLPLSATPNRPGNDSPFGAADVEVTYKEAVKEKAVKPLRGHSYVYTIEAEFLGTGVVKTYTTSELMDELKLGESVKRGKFPNPTEVEKRMIRRKMRWLPDYISPLVKMPLDRMINEKLRTGYPLQAIFVAMSVSHAKTVCTQVQEMYKDQLRIDWVGTGEFGRTEEENRRIVSELFCPPKDRFGRRVPKLDVLVNVGIAGEGLDSIWVSEIVFLTCAAINNRSIQVIGREARYLPQVVGNVNYESSSDFAKFNYTGSRMEYAMDFVSSQYGLEDEVDEGIDVNGSDYVRLPVHLGLDILSIELEGIDSGDPGFQRYKRMMEQNVLEGKCDFPMEELLDPDSPVHGKLLEAYKNMLKFEAEERNQQSFVSTNKAAVNLAVGKVANRVLEKRGLGKSRMPLKEWSKLLGKVIEEINRKKKYELKYPLSNDVKVCKRHYDWMINLETRVENGDIPSWLFV